ncbi:hypothetical protein BJ138DRAFT_1120072 [Hygrophoropsis aurantiaca]|uniref:Uncharacterized protein n=1 Tax=Hygrophoropsis aurantiaca TaxID=72124 RepID=A0ACB7ZTV4_9AGAM|nr:hypothetical protein BJ138DRAFT_1120072 [Hygrophoropsis aurantiaca]
MARRKKTTRPEKAGDRQRRATLRWLEKPGVKEAQRVKARDRAARNRALQKAVMKSLTSTSPSHSNSQDNSTNFQSPFPDGTSDVDGSRQTHSQSPKPPTTARHSAPMIPPDDFLGTLPSLRMEVREWQVDWGPGSAWSRNFDEDVRCVQEEGSHSTSQFFTNCENHIRRGRAILRGLRSLVQKPTGGSRSNITDCFIQVYDLSMEVLSELRFFELKLEEYAPAVSMKKASEVRHHSVI